METVTKHFDAGADDLEKINAFTRHPLRGEEVYTFSLLLCDNEIDRDGERFTIPALHRLAELFIGKTGIFDHAPSGKNQTARVYEAAVDSDAARTTSAGEPYTSLKAKAYMIRSEKNEPLIAEIEGGIKKEVSVGCAVGRVACSVCGGPRGGCAHQKGVSYGGTVCHHRLEEPTDAYEWSFVAVPAQKNAGVIKGFAPGGDGRPRGWEELRKALDSSGELLLSPGEADLLRERLGALEASASLGEVYRQDLAREVRRLAFLAGEQLEPRLLENVTQKLDIAELKAFRSAYEARLDQGGAARLLPSRSPGSPAAGDNDGFKM